MAPMSPRADLGMVDLRGPSLLRQRTPQDLTESLRLGLCPFCSAGPFVVVAIHTNRAHGIDRRMLRDYIGVTYTTSICDPTHSAVASERGREMHERGVSKLRQGNKGRPRRLSPAAQELNRQKLVAAHAKRDQAIESYRKNHAERTAERDARIVSMWEAGASLNQIGPAVGLNPKSVSRILKRRGVEEDGRARYHKSRRGVDSPGLRAQRERRTANLAAEREEMFAAYRDGEPIDSIAKRHGVTAKNVRERLRRNGFVIGDGRSEKPIPMVTFVCPVCGKTCEKRASDVARNRRAGWGGPFCSLSCGAKGRRR